GLADDGVIDAVVVGVGHRQQDVLAIAVQAGVDRRAVIAGQQQGVGGAERARAIGTVVRGQAEGGGEAGRIGVRGGGVGGREAVELGGGGLDADRGNVVDHVDHDRGAGAAALV